MPKSGFTAQWSGYCARCGELINVGDRVVLNRKRQAIHVGYASGQDDHD